MRNGHGIMRRSYVIYQNPAMQEKLEVKAPIQSLANIEELRPEIGIPDYVDLSNFQMTKTVVALWASRHPDRIVEGAIEEPLKLALFGGGGFKLHCPSANKGPFSRTIGDVDLVTLKENGKLVVQILLNLSEKCGSMFYHGITSADRRFNTLRFGMRYRIHTIQDIDEQSVPTAGLIDIFCDKLTFCHILDVRDELSQVDRHVFTIGLENLIISKAQLIKCVANDEASDINQNRIMGEYDKNHLLVGMETKDMRDVGAALLDHDLGEGGEKISIDVIGRKLRQDWGMWKTVTMNLKNMQNRLKPITDAFGAKKDEQEVIEERLAKIVQELEGKYAARKKTFSFNKQWWQDVEDQETITPGS